MKRKVGENMKQHEMIDNLRDAFLAGYWRDRPEGKLKVWQLTAEQKEAAKAAEAAAYEWARGRLAVLMSGAEL